MVYSTQTCLSCQFQRVASVVFVVFVIETETASRTARPFFTTDIVLSIPNVIMQPSVEEVQAGLNRGVQIIIAVSKDVLRWNAEPRMFRDKKVCDELTTLRCQFVGYCAKV